MKWVLALMLLIPGAAFADHICTNSPNEVYVGNTPAGQGQASMPVCRWAQSNEAAQPGAGPKPPPIVIERWHVVDDRFGAIAYDKNLGAYGFSADKATQHAADSEAVDKCAQRGGLHCELIDRFKNTCATFAWGAVGGAVRGGATIQESEHNALDACSSDTGRACDVVETVCSEPVYRVVDEKPDDFVEAD